VRRSPLQHPSPQHTERSSPCTMLLLFLPLLLPFLSLAFPFHPRADYGDCAPLYYTIKKFELTYDELRKELWTNLSMVVTYRANVQAGDANTECNLSTERRSTDNISVTDCVVQGTGSQAGQPTIISNSGMDYTFHGSLQNKDMQILHIWLCNGYVLFSLCR